MRIGLPDNAREAFQFLALGAAVVLAVRLLVLLLASGSGSANEDNLQSAIAPFRNGYPLLAADTFPMRNVHPAPRIAEGGLFTLLSGVLCAVPCLLVGLFRTDLLRKAVVYGGRIGLILGGAWAIWCICAQPASTCAVGSSGLVLRGSVTLMRAIPLPFTMFDHRIDWGHIQAINRTERVHSMDCGTTQHLQVQLANETIIIAESQRPEEDCEAAIAQQRAQMDLLVEHLATLQRQHSIN
ncbi:MAG: hypothetical protein IPM46_03990 [Flavobacteriales bacterium]|nr:hypothetical protein [Flavobacteriales bacterium]